MFSLLSGSPACGGGGRRLSVKRWGHSCQPFPKPIRSPGTVLQCRGEGGPYMTTHLGHSTQLNTAAHREALVIMSKVDPGGQTHSQVPALSGLRGSGHDRQPLPGLRTGLSNHPSLPRTEGAHRMVTLLRGHQMAGHAVVTGGGYTQSLFLEPLPLRELTGASSGPGELRPEPFPLGVLKSCLCL